MAKALQVMFFFLLGGLLLAIALFGVSGIWTKFLFISLRGLQNSLSGALVLIGLALLSGFFAGIRLRTK